MKNQKMIKGITYFDSEKQLFATDVGTIREDGSKGDLDATFYGKKEKISQDKAIQYIKKPL